MSELPRAKRQKIDKQGKFAAFARLKDLKGSKNKYEMSTDVDNVYDTVDEKEYAKRVLNRAAEDWIDDDGTGYVEDGREIFDDEEYTEGQQSSENKFTKSKSKKRSRETDSSSKGKGSIRNLFSNAIPKKKVPTVNLAEDDILADILGEMDSSKGSYKASSSSASRSRTCDIKAEAILVNEYMESFSKISKKTQKKDGNASDDEMLDRILKPEKKLIKNVVADEKIKKEIIDTDVSNLESKESLGTIINHNTESSDKFIESEEDFINMDFSMLDNIENSVHEKIEPKLEDDNIICIEDDNKNSIEDKTKEPTEEFLLTGWNSIYSVKEEVEEVITEPDEDTVISTTDIRIWYWDVWEDSYKRPGQVFLFGRVLSPEKVYQSVCVHVENVERCIYLLPREFVYDIKSKKLTKQTVTLMDVYKEFNEKIAPEINLDTYRSRKVIKNFSFNVPGIDVPESCEYLEVRYEGKKPSPNIEKERSTIAHIFGANTNSLEIFLLECKIKGPCWLNIKNFTIDERPFSWCKVEMRCNGIDSISLADEKYQLSPPLVMITLNVRTALNPRTSKNEIVMIGCLVHNKFALDKQPNPQFNRHFCGFTRPNSQQWPVDIAQKLMQFQKTKASKMDNERILLSWFLATFQNIDPDLIITYDANDCQLDVLCERLTDLKISYWSRIGRLRMSSIISKKFKDFFIGRMICDVKLSAEELIKARSFDLNTLCTTVLKIRDGERMDVSNDDLFSLYETSDGILKLISLTMQDGSYALRLMCEMNVIPLALQITTICGNIMGRTLQGGRSERNEFLLLHAFNEKNYIVPDRKLKEVNWGQLNSSIVPTAGGKKKAAYSGGLVLDPVKGFYDKFILLMDFNSLYPSIIQEYNICFTTVTETEDNTTPLLPDSSVEQGVLPRQIRRLVESRKEVKKLMMNPDLEPELRSQYNIRQLALKLTANSMYGCLGFGQSRFYAQHLAALVTLKGREILMNTKSLVQKLNYDVIYGDTDSIMINTNVLDYDQVYKIGNTIKQSVNKIYRQVELDIDGVFKYLLLLKKKKYAAVTVTKTKKGEMLYNQEHKGLDIVRRDWSQISVMAGKIILNEILSDNPMMTRVDNITAHLEKFGKNINENTVPYPLLVITKQLTKPPKDYVHFISLPHVQVALRMNATKNKRYKKGDMVSYIICDDGTDKPAMQRAYHLDELKSSDTLKVDTNYYLSHQIHPVVSRLCEPIDEIDASQIATCLGLDPSKFKATHKVTYDRQEEQIGESILTKNKYNFCSKFKFKCISCKTENEISSPIRQANPGLIAVLLKCVNNDCTTPPYKYVCGIQNQLILTIRTFIKKFYKNWFICDDPTCHNRTRIYTHVTNNRRPICLSCRQGVLLREYTESDLYNQLCYFESMFNLQNNDTKLVKLSPEVEEAYNSCQKTIDNYLSNSQYAVVDLKDFFSIKKIGKSK